MTIGAFARASRLSVKALRIYEQHRLLVPDHVDETTGYRYYRASQLDTARLIASLREIDMPLAGVAEVLCAEDHAAADRRIAFWWAGQEHALHVRRALVRSVRDEVSPAHGRANATVEIATAYRRTPGRVMLTVQHATTVEHLPTFIAESIGTLSPLVDHPAGTDKHPVIVIYHGRVNIDSDGPVEVCLTAPSDHPTNVVSLPPGVNLRRQDAQREVYATLSKTQLVYPDLLAAYSQLETRIRADGSSPIGPPREYYFTDIHTAHPDEPVCHVAIPVA